MDSTRFDNLTRKLAAGGSRRALLKGLATGLTGSFAGVRPTGAAQRAPRQPNGDPCTRTTDCASIHCVNGVCCDTVCPGQCESCATGTCQPVSGTPGTGRPACPGDGPCAATCDGQATNHCAAFPGAETGCGESTCDNDWQTTFACAGDGSCAPFTTSCAPYGCNAAGTACASGCQRDDDCALGSHCADGACVADEGLESPCDEDSDCQTGFCVDEVCCAERCGACQVCNRPGNLGFCGPAADEVACDVDGGDTCCEGGCVNAQTNVEHCGGCNQPCLGVPNGFAICAQGACGFGCLDGFKVCADTCIPVADCCTAADCPDGRECHNGICHCGSYVLAGANGIGHQLWVDDDLTITLDGQILLQDANQVHDVHDPVRFEAPAGGMLHVTATDSGGTCHVLEPIVLYCADDPGRTQTVTSGVTGPDAGNSVCDGAPPTTEPFVDVEVAIAI